MTLYDELVKLFREHTDASYYQLDGAQLVIMCSCDWHPTGIEPFQAHLAALACERAKQIIVAVCNKHRDTYLEVPSTSSSAAHGAAAGAPYLHNVGLHVRYRVRHGPITCETQSRA